MLKTRNAPISGRQVICLSLTGARFQPLFQASDDLSKADVYDNSSRKAYGWIGRQNDEALIPKGDSIVRSFPDGPHDELLDKVDIVVVTPERVLPPEPN